MTAIRRAAGSVCILQSIIAVKISAGYPHRDQSMRVEPQ
jgi:hypothetical protein